MKLFETDRLLVRQFEHADLDALAALTSDPRIMRFVGNGVPLTRAEVQEWIAASRKNQETHGYGTGAVVDKSTRVLMGWAGFARPADGDEELIYGLAHEHWGNGYGSELLAGLIGYAANDLQLGVLRALVHPDNHRSVSMLLRAGFVLADSCYEGESDTHLYALDTNRSV